MGIVIQLPPRTGAASPSETAPARRGEVVILPVIRIERYESTPGELAMRRKAEPVRKRRHNATRP